jgi:hypothetical protein
MAMIRKRSARTKEKRGLLLHHLGEWPIGGPVTITLIRGKENLEMTVLPSEAGT